LDALLVRICPDESERWAFALIVEFGSLPATLSARQADLTRIVPATAAAFLIDVQRVILHTLKMQVEGNQVVATSDQLLAYLRARLAHSQTEQLRVLYLAPAGHLLADELMADGCISEVAIYPRQILRRALEVSASALILVHNHPSGDHRPSKADIEATRRVAQACMAMEISLHDHLIIARSGWSSFKLLGLL